MINKTCYNIGQFEPVMELTDEERSKIINQLPDISRSLQDILKILNHKQLQVPCRPGGWTIQQIINHMSDNDMNAYFRFKRALTEDEPYVDSYREDLFAELTDYINVPISASLILLEALHFRFYILLNGLNQDDFKKTLKTQALGVITLDIALQRFIWHNLHHISQINSLIAREGW